MQTHELACFLLQVVVVPKLPPDCGYEALLASTELDFLRSQGFRPDSGIALQKKLRQSLSEKPTSQGEPSNCDQTRDTIGDGDLVGVPANTANQVSLRTQNQFDELNWMIRGVCHA